MPYYVGLFKFTDFGRQNIKSSPDRLAAARQAAAKVGVKLDTVLYTMGEYDLVGIAEAPDDETMAKMSATIMSLRGVTTTTMRAFTPEEFRKITADLPSS
ncbi:MAG TPA: GYD domain-containing protein [Chloroflexota bacterium]|jgi:uncharacterized protein with GYD domain|nr:GYD domain-containing protein [Chloroflexota bacterium]